MVTETSVSAVELPPVGAVTPPMVTVKLAVAWFPAASRAV